MCPDACKGSTPVVPKRGLTGRCSRRTPHASARTWLVPRRRGLRPRLLAAVLRSQSDPWRSLLNGRSLDGRRRPMTGIQFRPMICLDVHVNGRKVCRAGVGKYGIVHVNAGWSRSPPAWRTGGRIRKASGTVSVSGVHYARRPPVHENVSWLSDSFSPGDELLVRCLDAPVADEPSQRNLAQEIPEDEQMEMIRSSLASHAQRLGRLKVKGAAQMGRQLRTVLKRFTGEPKRR